MKQKDIAVIIIIGAISAVFSLVLSNVFIGTPQNKKVDVEVVEAISPDFTDLDPRYFNNEAVNPTQIIQIQGNETKPFN